MSKEEKKKVDAKLVNKDNVQSKPIDEIEKLKSKNKELSHELENAKESLDEISKNFVRVQASLEAQSKVSEALKEDIKRINERNKDIKIDAKENAIIETSKKLLPILDNFENAIEVAEKNDTTKGFSMIADQIKSILLDMGLKEIQTDNADFNAEYHNAIMKQPNDNKNLSGKIYKVLAKGYQLENGKIIRHSVVIIYE